MAGVVIYTTDHCSYCHAAVELLKKQKVAFKQVDVTGDDAMREKLVKMSGGRQTVPVIFAGERCIGGYDELAAFFKSGGKL